MSGMYFPSARETVLDARHRWFYLGKNWSSGVLIIARVRLCYDFMMKQDVLL